MTKGIRSAIVYCAGKTDRNDVEGLRHDIRNAPYHVFGFHENCREYFCDRTVEEGAKDLIPELKQLGIWNKILVIVEKLAAKAESINENKTSNL